MPKPIPPSLLEKHWIHSHEEDTSEAMVFRPADFAFPPSRGRRALDLKADHTLVETGLGATDRPEHSRATWKLEADRLAIFHGAKAQPDEVLQLVDAADDKLVIKKPS